MKAVILAGGFGTRLSEETGTRPKPMVEVGGKPLLWHIMKTYLAHGVDEFVICCGYKAYVIKEYFANYALHNSDFTYDFRTDRLDIHHSAAEPWSVTVVDTGETTMTGGRLKRVADYVGDDDFCFTYGDGVADVDITRLIEFHRASGSLATLTAAQPAGRWGALHLEGDQITSFEEKPDEGGWINGGYFVCSPKVLDYIDGDATSWELEPMQRLAREGQLTAYRHDGFWLPMDTLRDHTQLQALWASGSAPWKVWS
jgi:glucose-1-phosphate cytidylyltransferase